MITICREKISSDDSPILRALAKKYVCKNFDDERIVFPNWEGDRLLRVARRALRRPLISHFNSAILSYAETNHDFDVFAFKAPALRAGTCAYLKEHGGKLVVYNPDLSFHSPENNMEKIVPFVDVYLSTKRGFDRNFLKPAGFSGKYIHVLPHYSSEIFFNHFENLKVRKRVVGFLGNFSEKKYYWIQSILANTNWTVEIIGNGWPGGLGKKVKLLGAIYGEPAFSIARTWEVSLGLLQEANQHHPFADQITIRSVEQPAAGVFMIHEETEEVRRLYGEKLCCFNNVSSLIGLLESINASDFESQILYRREINSIARNLGIDSDGRSVLLSEIFESVGIARGVKIQG